MRLWALHLVAVCARNPTTSRGCLQKEKGARTLAHNTKLPRASLALNVVAGRHRTAATRRDGPGDVLIGEDTCRSLRTTPRQAPHWVKASPRRGARRAAPIPSTR